MKSKRGNAAALWLVVALFILGTGTSAASPRGETPAVNADGQPVVQFPGEPSQPRSDSDQFTIVFLTAFAVATAATALLPGRHLADQ